MLRQCTHHCVRGCSFSDSADVSFAIAHFYFVNHCRSSDDDAGPQTVGNQVTRSWMTKRCYYRNPAITDLFLQLERIREGSKVANVCQVQLTTEAKDRSKFSSLQHK